MSGVLPHEPLARPSHGIQDKLGLMRLLQVNTGGRDGAPGMHCVPSELSGFPNAI